MGDRLKSLVNSCLRKAMVHGSRLAERVPGIPDDVLDGVALLARLEQLIDNRPPPVRPRSHEREGRDDAGNLRSERGPLDAVGPPDVPGLHGQVQFEAHVWPGRPTVGGRAVPRSGIAVYGVLLATVRPNAQYPRLPDCPALLRCLLHELCLGGLPVEFYRGAVPVQRTPGLDVGPIDRY